MKKVMCFGTFDNFHPGHKFYLKESKSSGDYLVVVVARDQNVEVLKGKTPCEAEQVRLERLKKIDFIDEAVLGGRKNKFLVIKKFKPDIISLGYDQLVNLEKLQNVFKGEIVRQKALKPEIYKSSKIKCKK